MRLALEAVCIFHSGSPWDAPKNMRWQVICQTLLRKPDVQQGKGHNFDATTKVLCDMVRAALADKPEKTT